MGSSAKNIGLVLAGGGARAAYQAGVIKALSQIIPGQNIPFRVLVGTSAGAINAAFLAGRAEQWAEGSEQLCDLWRNLTLNHVYRTDSFSLTRIAFGWVNRLLFGGRNIRKKTKSNFLLDTGPLAELLQKEISFDRIRQSFTNQSLQGICVTSTQYFSGTTVSFFEGSTEIEAWERRNRIGIRTHLNYKHILASSAIPVFFPPVEMEDQYYGDGSLRESSPLSPAIHLGADKIICVGLRHRGAALAHLNRESQGQPPSLAQIGGELMNSMFLDSIDSDVERIQHINRNLHALKKEFGNNYKTQIKDIPVLQLLPSQDLQTLLPSMLKKFPLTLRFFLRGMGVSAKQGNGLISYLSFLPECSIPLMDLGYQDTLARRDEILRFLSDDDSN